MQACGSDKPKKILGVTLTGLPPKDQLYLPHGNEEYMHKHHDVCTITPISNLTSATLKNPTSALCTGICAFSNSMENTNAVTHTTQKSDSAFVWGISFNGKRYLEPILSSCSTWTLASDLFLGRTQRSLLSSLTGQHRCFSSGPRCVWNVSQFSPKKTFRMPNSWKCHRLQNLEVSF